MSREQVKIRCPLPFKWSLYIFFVFRRQNAWLGREWNDKSWRRRSDVGKTPSISVVRLGRWIWKAYSCVSIAMKLKVNWHELLTSSPNTLFYTNGRILCAWILELRMQHSSGNKKVPQIVGLRPPMCRAIFAGKHIANPPNILEHFQPLGLWLHNAHKFKLLPYLLPFRRNLKGEFWDPQFGG